MREPLGAGREPLQPNAPPSYITRSMILTEAPAPTAQPPIQNVEPIVPDAVERAGREPEPPATVEEPATQTEPEQEEEERHTISAGNVDILLAPEAPHREIPELSLPIRQLYRAGCRARALASCRAATQRPRVLCLKHPARR